MKRLLSLAILAGLFVWTGAALAQDAITIKIKELAEGESGLVDKNDKGMFAMKITDADGKTLKESKEESAESFTYKETVVKRDGKKVLKQEREYTKAELTKGGKPVDAGLAGKTVLIERKGEKYSFTFKGGEEVKGEAAAVLEKEFKDKSEDTDLDKLLLPKGAVKPGEEWKLDMGPIIKTFGKGDAMEADVAKSKGTGKLLKVYKKDGKTFGQIQYNLEIPIKSAGKGNDQLTFKEGAKMVMEMTLDSCIDGTSGAGTMKMKMDLNGSATHPMLPGGVFLLSSKAEGTETQKEAPKK